MNQFLELEMLILYCSIIRINIIGAYYIIQTTMIETILMVCDYSLDAWQKLVDNNVKRNKEKKGENDE